RTCLGAFTLASTAASTATLLFSGFLVVWASVVVGLDGARSTGLSPVSGLATSATPAAFLLRSVFAFVAVRGLVVTCGHAATAAGGPIGSIGSIGARIGVDAGRTLLIPIVALTGASTTSASTSTALGLAIAFIEHREGRIELGLGLALRLLVDVFELLRAGPIWV